MKILAADDNSVARIVLKAFLEKSGYEALVVEDGHAALKELMDPNGAHIAILDWMMPGISGPEVCTKLRAANLPIRPYVILLTSRADKSDIVIGLDAGADEFITKPFNQIEMLARLRAAQRVIQYEAELQQRIEDLAAMVTRYEMRGDMIVHGKEALRPETAAVERPIEAEDLPEPVIDITQEELNASLHQAFSDLGWTDLNIQHEVLETPYERKPLIAWAGFFLDPVQVWLDFILEVKAEDAEKLYAHSMQKNPTNERAVLDFLAEALSLLIANLKSYIEMRDGTIIAPFLSRGLKMGNLSRGLPIPPGPRDHCLIRTNGVELGLTILHNLCPVKFKTAGQLNRGDILAEPFLPSEAYQIPLLNRGTVLNDRFIERLITLAHMEGKPVKLELFEPSRLSTHFNPSQSGKKLRLDED